MQMTTPMSMICPNVLEVIALSLYVTVSYNTSLVAKFNWF